MDVFLSPERKKERKEIQYIYPQVRIEKKMWKSKCRKVKDFFQVTPQLR